MRGTSCSARNSGIVPRNQVRWPLSHNQARRHPVLGMEGGLLSCRWLGTVRGTQGKSMRKGLRGLGLGFSSAHGLTVCPIFPTRQMGIIFLVCLPINGIIDMSTSKKSTTEL